MEFNYKKLTEKPTITSISSSDKLIVNSDGSLKQATVNNIVNASNLKGTVDNLDNTVDNLSYGEVAGGKNLIDIYDNIYYDEVLGISTKNLVIGKTYTFSSNKNITFKISYRKSGVNYIVKTGTSGTFVMPNYDNVYIFIELKDSNIWIADISDFEKLNIQVEEGSTATAYEPYIPSVKMLAKKVNDDLKMLGWTVPSQMSVQNYTDSNGVFHQRVGRVDLGSLDYIYDAANTRLMSSIISDMKQFENWNNRSFVFCDSNYSVSSISASTDNMSVGLYGYRIYIKNTSYTDATAFKQAMQGTYLYYELGTEKTFKVDGNETVVELGNTLGKCKNLLNPTLATTTKNGVTCTNNEDGTYTLNGTATSNATFIIEQGLIVSGRYKIICFKSPLASNKFLCVNGYNNNSWVKVCGYDYNNYIDIDSSVTPLIKFEVTIGNGVTLNNEIIKPMLCTNLSASYDDFVPYTGNGDTLTHDVANIYNAFNSDYGVFKTIISNPYCYLEVARWGRVVTVYGSLNGGQRVSQGTQIAAITYPQLRPNDKLFYPKMALPPVFNQDTAYTANLEITPDGEILIKDNTEDYFLANSTVHMTYLA